MTEALVGLAVMMALALLRIPIAFSMGVVGFLGVAYLRDWNFAPAMAMVKEFFKKVRRVVCIDTLI